MSTSTASSMLCIARLCLCQAWGRFSALQSFWRRDQSSASPAVGNYVSYCRKAETVWTRSDRVKGRGNRKNGNRYLAWAFSEAADHSRRFDTASRNFFNRKLRERNSLVAHSALANKLARAAYYIMRDQVPYEEAKLFG